MGEERLFDLRNDPSECIDLSGDEERLSPPRQALEKTLRGRNAPVYYREKRAPCCNRPPRALYPHSPGAR